MLRLFPLLLFLIPACNIRHSPIGSEPSGRAENLYVYCEDGYSCAPYEVCVTDGIVWCENRSCWTEGRINLSCVDAINAGDFYTPPPSYSPDAGSYTPPPPPAPTPTPTPSPSATCSVGYRSMPSLRQRPDGQICLFEHRPEGRTWAGGWLGAICETGPCTIEILSFTLYGVLPDGRVTTVSSGIRWAGVFNNFFRTNDSYNVGPIYGSTYNVPRLAEDATLHMGGDVVNISGYVETFVVAEFRTTGDAQAQVGVDYRHGRDDLASTLEAGFSSYASCTTGGSVRVASPRYGMSCEATLASASGAGPAPSPPPPPPPPSSGYAIYITLPSPGTNGCSGAFSATAWGAYEAHYSSGTTLSYTETGEGYLWWNLYCAGTPWGSRWGGVGTRATALAGLTVLVDGVNRTSDTTICPNGSNLMPMTWLDPGRSGCL